MKKLSLFFALLAAGCFCCRPAQAQFLKKLKDKINQAVDKKVSDAAGVPATAAPAGAPATAGGPVNTTGNGLTNTTPPNIGQSIDNAEKAGNTADYTSARYALQQASLGLELTIGRQILQSLPATVQGLARDTAKNLVSSSQVGWGNLIIQTVYSDGKNKQMTITIGNNPMYAGIVNMYYNNAAMVQANGGNQGQGVKQTMVKGNKALIQFSGSEGYTLFMQLGQQSMIVWKCINFATEDDVMAAANAFDIDSVRKDMGEQ